MERDQADRAELDELAERESERKEAAKQDMLDVDD